MSIRYADDSPRPELFEIFRQFQTDAHPLFIKYSQIRF